jgi:hypothetical protein
VTMSKAIAKLKMIAIGEYPQVVTSLVGSRT